MSRAEPAALSEPHDADKAPVKCVAYQKLCETCTEPVSCYDVQVALTEPLRASQRTAVVAIALLRCSVTTWYRNPRTLTFDIDPSDEHVKKCYAEFDAPPRNLFEAALLSKCYAIAVFFLPTHISDFAKLAPTYDFLWQQMLCCGIDHAFGTLLRCMRRHSSYSWLHKHAIADANCTPDAHLGTALVAWLASGTIECPFSLSAICTIMLSPEHATQLLIAQKHLVQHCSDRFGAESRSFANHSSLDFITEIDRQLGAISNPSPAIIEAAARFARLILKKRGMAYFGSNGRLFSPIIETVLIAEMAKKDTRSDRFVVRLKRVLQENKENLDAWPNDFWSALELLFGEIYDKIGVHDRVVLLNDLIGTPMSIRGLAMLLDCEAFFIWMKTGSRFFQPLDNIDDNVCREEAMRAQSAIKAAKIDVNDYRVDSFLISQHEFKTWDVDSSGTNQSKGINLFFTDRPQTKLFRYLLVGEKPTNVLTFDRHTNPETLLNFCDADIDNAFDSLSHWIRKQSLPTYDVRAAVRRWAMWVFPVVERSECAKKAFCRHSAVFLPMLAHLELHVCRGEILFGSQRWTNLLVELSTKRETISVPDTWFDDALLHEAQFGTSETFSALFAIERAWSRQLLSRVLAYAEHKSLNAHLSLLRESPVMASMGLCCFSYAQKQLSARTDISPGDICMDFEHVESRDREWDTIAHEAIDKQCPNLATYATAIFLYDNDNACAERQQIHECRVGSLLRKLFNHDPRHLRDTSAYVQLAVAHIAERPDLLRCICDDTIYVAISKHVALSLLFDRSETNGRDRLRERFRAQARLLTSGSCKSEMAAQWAPEWNLAWPWLLADDDFDTTEALSATCGQFIQALSAVSEQLGNIVPLRLDYVCPDLLKNPTALPLVHPFITQYDYDIVLRKIASDSAMLVKLSTQNFIGVLDNVSADLGDSKSDNNFDIDVPYVLDKLVSQRRMAEIFALLKFRPDANTQRFLDAAKQKTPKDTEQAEWEDEDDRLCIVCMVDERRIAFKECGHVTHCEKCDPTFGAADMKAACPVCRKKGFRLKLFY